MVKYRQVPLSMIIHHSSPPPTQPADTDIDNKEMKPYLSLSRDTTATYRRGNLPDATLFNNSKLAGFY